MSEKSKVTQEELIEKIKEWSKNYKQARKKIGIDFDELNLEELITRKESLLKQDKEAKKNYLLSMKKLSITLKILIKI